MTHVRTDEWPGPGTYRPRVPRIYIVFIVAGLIMIAFAVTVGVIVATHPIQRAPGCGRACVPATYVPERAPERDE